MKLAYDFRKEARERLKGHWGVAILAVLITLLLGGMLQHTEYHFSAQDNTTEISIEQLRADGDINAFMQRLNGNELNIFAGVATGVVVAFCIYALLCLLLGPAVSLGSCVYFTSLARSEPSALSQLFSRTNIWLKALGLRFVTGFFIVLWTLLFVIPGIIAAYRYAMAPYIMADNPDIGIMEAIDTSKEMMRGNKGRLFCLELSFIGWSLLASVCMGVLVYVVGRTASPVQQAALSLSVIYLLTLPLAAYTQTARAGFYLEMTQPHMQA